MKYHVTAAIINAIIIYCIVAIYRDIITVIDGSYLARRGHHITSFYTYALLIFSWIATMIIYKIRNYTRHYLYFIGINLLAILTIRLFLYSRFIMTSTTDFDIKVLFITIGYSLKDNIIPLLVISIIVHISQNLIGKKLLPKKYKPLK